MKNDFLCFDTESAQGRLGTHYVEELIEISILDVFGESLFYQRFKPARLKKWDPSVHHITPAMVKDQPKVKSRLKEIQSIFDNTEYIIGFSLIDDFKALRQAGVKGLDDKKKVELRHLYWYCVGRHHDIPFHSGPGLSKCAEDLNIKVVEEAVHSASGDTRVTLNLFLELMRMFLISEDILKESDSLDIHSLTMPKFKGYVELALKRIDSAKFDYDRKCAGGYIHVIPEDNGYKFMSSITAEYDGAAPVISLSVNARKRALYDLENMFERRRSRASRKIFNLTENDLKKIREYTNIFDGQEQLYQKLTGLRRAGNNL